MFVNALLLNELEFKKELPSVSESYYH